MQDTFKITDRANAVCFSGHRTFKMKKMQGVLFPDQVTGVNSPEPGSDDFGISGVPAPESGAPCLKAVSGNIFPERQINDGWLSKEPTCGKGEPDLNAGNRNCDATMSHSAAGVADDEVTAAWNADGIGSILAESDAMACMKASGAISAGTDTTADPEAFGTITDGMATMEAAGITAKGAGTNKMADTSRTTELISGGTVNGSIITEQVISKALKAGEAPTGKGVEGSKALHLLPSIHPISSTETTAGVQPIPILPTRTAATAEGTSKHAVDARSTTTGSIRTRNQTGEIRRKLEETVSLLAAGGYTDFLCGMAEGFDLLAAGAVVEVRKTRPEVKLIAVVPFRGQSRRYGFEARDCYERLIRQADRVVILSENYTSDCFHRRNDWLVENSSLLVCHFNGSPGGTRYTVSKAVSRGMRIINIT